MVLELQVLLRVLPLVTWPLLARWSLLHSTLSYLVLVTLAVLLLAHSSLFVYLSLEAGCRFIDCYICASIYLRTGLNFDRVLRRIA